MKTTIEELAKIIQRDYPKFINIVRKIDKLKQDNEFGNCSVCGKDNGCLNVGRSHYFICHKHKKFWNVGSNLFSGWRNENEKIWIKNSKKLDKYNEIDGYEWLNDKIKRIENIRLRVISKSLINTN